MAFEPVVASQPVGDPLPVVRAGDGPPVVLIHGSATDRATWMMQIASPLTARVRLIACDRRGSGGADGTGWTVEEQADDVAALIAGEGPPVVLVGSSFGSVVALEILRSHRGLARGAVLCEPPVPADDDGPPVTQAFVEVLERIADEHGGPAAAEAFLRRVLGDAGYERMPRLAQDRVLTLWPAIRADCRALGEYRVRYHELAAITAPVLLLGGARSPSYFRTTLEAFQRALGNATLELLPDAGHMMHAEVFRRFNQRLADFCDQIGHV